jgi:hypothetical protein
MVGAPTNLVWSQKSGVRVVQRAQQTPNCGVSSNSAADGVLEGLVSFCLQDLRSSVRQACWASILYRASNELVIWVHRTLIRFVRSDKRW